MLEHKLSQAFIGLFALLPVAASYAVCALPPLRSLPTATVCIETQNSQAVPLAVESASAKMLGSSKMGCSAGFMSSNKPRTIIPGETSVTKAWVGHLMFQPAKSAVPPDWCSQGIEVNLGYKRIDNTSCEVSISKSWVYGDCKVSLVKNQGCSAQVVKQNSFFCHVKFEFSGSNE